MATKERMKVRPSRQKRTANSAQDDVVYTQPMAFHKGRFMLRLLTVLGVVVAIILSMAIFFKVKTIAVSGTDKYTAWDIRTASGIREGENLLTLSDAQISGRITTSLPYVKQVRVGIKLPDTVNIVIEELQVTYAMQATDETWWLISAEGRVVDSVSFADAQRNTQILGVKLASPVVGQQAVAEEPTQEAAGDLPEGATKPVTVKGFERLELVIAILQNLEKSGILGQMKSVDVTNVGAVELWYENRFQINLGDDTQLSRKIKAVKAAIDSPEMGDYSAGTMDASFTIWQDRVGFRAFTE